MSRQPFGYNRSLFIKGNMIEDEIAFEEYRAQFYTIPSADTTTPKKDTSMMDIEDPFTPLQIDPAKRKLDFNETPLTKSFHTLSIASHTNDDMTINTRGVLNEMSDMFGRYCILSFDKW